MVLKTVNSPGFPPEKENIECERDSKKRKSSYKSLNTKRATQVCSVMFHSSLRLQNWLSRCYLDKKTKCRIFP